MDRGTWWATVHRLTNRVGHDLVTKQKQSFTENCFFPPIFEYIAHRELILHTNFGAINPT